jgi:hypothetical protein
MKARIITAIAICLIVASLGFYLSNRPTVTGNAAIETSVMVFGTSFALNCTIPLHQGWNLISEPCAIDNATLFDIVSSINASYDSILTYDQTGNPTWNVYKKDLPDYVFINLTSFETKRGYWINITSASNLTVNGSIITFTEISLHKGKNLVGYPVNKTVAIASAFGGAFSSIITIEAYNASTQTYEIYDARNTSNATLNFITFGRGYWINMSADATWVVST